MQQRRLRLGDILDDYCPRERRITNHAVVAMIDDTVKQTRCTTCDAEHEYKQAKVPAARRKKTAVPAAQLVDASRLHPEHDVPDDAPAIEEAAMLADDSVGTDLEVGPEEEHDDVGSVPEAEFAGAADPADEAIDENIAENDERDNWPVHRPLIRATLPRPEGQTPERKAPDFTFRPAGGKFDSRNGNRHRGHRPSRQAHGGQGHSPSGHGSRFGGQRGPGGHGGQGGGPQGQRHGNRSGQGGGQGRPGQGQGQGRGPRPGGGRKRGR